MIKPKGNVAIIAIGDELLTGRVDTNGPALDARLRRMGLTPGERLILPDEEQVVANAVQRLLKNYQVVICCGGLGPTQDDVTRQAIARALRLPLITKPAWQKPLHDYFKKLKRAMPEVNKIQAMLPRGAAHLVNHWGTAQGFAVAIFGHVVAALPGPPRECLPMMDQVLAPWLQQHLRLPSDRVEEETLRTCGVPEGRLQEILGPLFPIQGQIKLGFLLDEPGEVLVKLRASQERQSLHASVKQVRQCLGVHVVDPQAAPLEQVVGKLLQRRRQTLAVAESCTGGLIAQRLTSVAGSSHCFLEAAVTYSNAAKIRRLGVPQVLLASKGAVSPEVALAMARGVRRSSQADWGLGVTGIAGPGGGTRNKPVGLVYLAVVGPGTEMVEELKMIGDREFIQRRSATSALDRLRRQLIEK